MLNYLLDRTHDPSHKSWVSSANHSDTDFPIQNLPFGRFQRQNLHHSPHIGVAIGNQILDISACLENSLLQSLPEQVQQACRADTLNPLMALGQEALTLVRLALSDFLNMRSESPQNVEDILVPMNEANLLLPCLIGDYTDFYASIFHATNVGSLFRPQNPLLPNYKYVPIAYHGRASSIEVSPTQLHRPKGQKKLPEQIEPTFGLSQMLDYEIEVGFFIGAGNTLGSPVAIAEAESHIFGLCLVNDWSARDIQAWEYQPLGPFLGKNFATTLSPWIVTLDALAPFRCHAFERSIEDPQPLPYLFDAENERLGGINLTVDVRIQSAQMKQEKVAPFTISHASLQSLYWTAAQMVTHHTSNGCNLRPGDLLASGTVSGKGEQSRGSLLEMTQKGTQPLSLPTGETRKFLEDGDEVIFNAYCAQEGYVRIGLGECRGTVVSEAVKVVIAQ